MSSDRRILALGLVALATSACMSPAEPQPPALPRGRAAGAVGAAAQSWSLRNGRTRLREPSRASGFDGVYAASAASGAGGGHSRPDRERGDKLLGTIVSSRRPRRLRLLQPGVPRRQDRTAAGHPLVFEGYWRYLEVPDPTAKDTGLIRLFVRAGNRSRSALCRGEAVAPGAAPLVGATGGGNTAPAAPLTVQLHRSPQEPANAEGQKTFLVGVHHGGCQTTDNCGISENTRETSILAEAARRRLPRDRRPSHQGQGPGLLPPGARPRPCQGLYCTGRDRGLHLRAAARQLPAPQRRDHSRGSSTCSSTSTRAPTSRSISTEGDRRHRPGEPDHRASCRTARARAVRRPRLPGDCRPPGSECLFPGSRPVCERGIIGLPSDDIVNDVPAGARRRAARAEPALPRRGELDDVTSIPCVAWMPRYTRGPMPSDVQSLQRRASSSGYWTINDPKTIDAFLTAGRAERHPHQLPRVVNQRFEVVGIAAVRTPVSRVTHAVRTLLLALALAAAPTVRAADPRPLRAGRDRALRPGRLDALRRLRPARLPRPDTSNVRLVERRPGLRAAASPTGARTSPTPSSTSRTSRSSRAAVRERLRCRAAHSTVYATNSSYALGLAIGPGWDIDWFRVRVGVGLYDVVVKTDVAGVDEHRLAGRHRLHRQPERPGLAPRPVRPGRRGPHGGARVARPTGSTSPCGRSASPAAGTSSGSSSAGSAGAILT